MPPPGSWGSRDGVPFHHVHGAGKMGCRHMAEYLDAAGIDLSRHPDLDWWLWVTLGEGTMMAGTPRAVISLMVLAPARQITRSAARMT